MGIVLRGVREHGISLLVERAGLWALYYGGTRYSQTPVGAIQRANASTLALHSFYTRTSTC